MKWGRWSACMACWVVASIASLVVVPVACLFAGDRFPRWARLWETPDDTGLQAGVTEPAVAAVYARCGWYLKHVYWHLRNRALGVQYAFALPAITEIAQHDGWNHEYGFKLNLGAFYWRRPLAGRTFLFAFGWKTHTLGARLLAYPFLTIRWQERP